MAVDMTTYEMLDDVNLSLVEPLASGAFAIAGYVNGRYTNWPAIVAKYGKAGKFLLSIDVQGNAQAGAQCLDVETGDAVIGQVAAWVKATRAAGIAAHDLRYYPKVYTSAGNVAAVISALSAAGIKRSEYLIWSAHYTGTSHICSPKTCGYPQADATQWTSTFHGASLDASLAYGYFFAGPGGAVPGSAPVAAPVVTVDVPKVEGLTAAEAVAELVKVGLRTDVAADVPGTVVSQTPGAGVKVDKGSKVDLAVKAPVPKPEPVVVVPEPVVEPVSAPVAKPSLTVYVQEVLDATVASKLGLPVGCILFIPHIVEGD